MESKLSYVQVQRLKELGRLETELPRRYAPMSRFGILFNNFMHVITFGADRNPAGGSELSNRRVLPTPIIIQSYAFPGVGAF